MKKTSEGKPEVVRVRLLGGFTVSVGTRTVGEKEWRRRKVAALIKLLALTPRHRLHREQVMEYLWPDSGMRAASNNLRQALHAARKALDVTAGSRYLASRDESLLLCPESPLWVDVENFEEAAATARRAREPAAYRAAIDLYTGELLPADRYEEWVEEHRRRLREMYLSLLVGLARLCEERADYDSAAEALRRVLSEELTREEAHAGLMRLYALEASKGEALAQYGWLEDVLSRELGAEPAASSRALREEIAAGRFPPKGARSLGSPPEETPDAPPCNLPATRTSFVGREREMVEVKRELAMTRLLTLTGAGGCGKTRLALEVARDLVGAYPDGVWLVELASLSEGALVPQAVAEALRLKERSGQPLTDTLAEALRSKHTLLVLDNCEHLVDAAARLVDVLLDSCPRLRVLATSREALGIAGETNWVVPSLSVPDPRRSPTVQELEGYESARLFAERASDRRPGFALEPTNAQAVVEICRRLEGVPLAIELAAARVGVLSVEQISERLADLLMLLTGGSRTETPRQRTLRGTLDWSYELLCEPERQLFRQLSVFAGGWTLEAAEAVASDDGVEERDVLELLTGLVDKSLVVAEAAGDGGLRYRMLEPVRQYGREKLEASEQAEAVRRRHADFFVGLAEEAEPELTGAEQRIWLNRLETELDNVRMALGWSLEDGEPEVGLRLAGAFWWFCYLRGHYGEGREWLEGALAKSEDSPPALRAKALTGAGVLAFLQCEYGLATARLEDSLTLCRELGDERGVASALQVSGSVAREQGRYARAQVLHEESLSLWRELGDEWGVARSLNYLGFAAWLQENYERARVLCAEALSLFRTLGDVEGTAWALISLGAVAQYRRDLERAGALLEESLTLSQEAGYREGIAWSLNELGIVAYRRDDLAWATALLKESLEVHHDLGDRWRIASVLEGLAGSARAQGEFKRAARLFGAAEALREVTGTPVPLCERPDRDSNVAAARARLDAASWEAAFAEGRSMTFAQAVEYALAAEKSTPPTSAASGEKKALAGAQSPTLTRREREVASLVARGLTNRQIASELVVSEHTVRHHVTSILKKLNLRSREQVSSRPGDR